MTPLHSKTHRLYVGGYDLSQFFRAFTSDETVSDADTTVFADTARRFQPGVSEDAASGDGILHTDPELARDIMRDAMGAQGSIVVSLPVDETGARGFALPAYQAKWAMSFPQDDIVDVQAEWKAQDGAMHPVVLLPATSQAAAVTGTQVDLGAGTHDVTLVAQLLELATFTGVVVKVQHRALEADPWVDVAALTTASLAEHDHSSLSTSGISRYVRAVATPAGGSGSFTPSVVIATT